MVGVRGTILAFVVLACIAAEPALGQTNRPVDGRPRPRGYPDNPSMAYGETPPCYLNSVAVTCEWYGFAHNLYPAEGAVCMANMRKALSNTTLVPLGVLEPYEYYFSSIYVFDISNNDSYCLYGCFDLSADGPIASPPLGFSAPPPVALVPPPVALATPPPATLFPPPPVADLAPPPVLTAPPPPSTLLTPPPDSVPTPPTALPPTNLPPPPPGNTRVINLNGAAFLQPTGLLSFIISGALLILHGLVAF